MQMFLQPLLDIAIRPIRLGPCRLVILGRPVLRARARFLAACGRRVSGADAKGETGCDEYPLSTWMCPSSLEDVVGDVDVDFGQSVALRVWLFVGVVLGLVCRFRCCTQSDTGLRGSYCETGVFVS